MMLPYKITLIKILLNRKNGKKLLDTGCGVGNITSVLAKHGFDVAGIDLSPVAVSKAKEEGINAIVCDIDKEGLPFETGSFDVVWASDLVEHLFDPLSFMGEAHRILNQNGRFLLSVPNDFNLYARLTIALSGKALQSDIYRKLKQCKHHTFFSVELLEYMLVSSGFEIVKMIGCNLVPRIGWNFTTNSRLISLLFAHCLIVEAKVIEQL